MAVAATAVSRTDKSPSTTSASKTLSKFQVGRLLGRGSFAKVYHARPIYNKEADAVAIKVNNKGKMDSAMKPLIVKEVEGMRRWNHPNILNIHEINLIMELAKGGDLFVELSRGPCHRFSEPIARRYFTQMISSLHNCHKNNVAGRVKPMNLLLDEDGNIKLSHFGLSSVAEVGEANALFLKTACGTQAFVAPEVLGRSRDGYNGSKADAWSCGVILFVLLSGSLPFDDSNLALMYRKMHNREFKFPSWVSKPARRLITPLLDPKPATRLSIQAITLHPWFKNQAV